MNAPRCLELPGRILWLVNDEDLVVRQLRGQTIAVPPAESLLPRLSTDEIIPAWSCFVYDERLGDDALVGLRGGHVRRGDLRRAQFSVLVTGPHQGSGSSREVAPLALWHAGIRLLIAPNFESIYLQNCHNMGLFTSTDLGLAARLMDGERVEVGALVEGLTPLAAEVLSSGGLLAFARECKEKRRVFSLAKIQPRPMTRVEKIIARCAVTPDGIGMSHVEPSMELFVKADLRFSHDYVTAMVARWFHQSFGDDAKVHDPESVLLFSDHLALLPDLGGAARPHRSLLDHARALLEAEVAFAERQAIRLYPASEVATDSDNTGICHQVILDDWALPGMLIVGTDSHTTTAGALGALAFGIGSTDMALGLANGQVRVRVPRCIRIELKGRLRRGVTAKDLMLALMCSPTRLGSLPQHCALEFTGGGLESLSLDERATIANMAVEAGAFTAILDVDSDTAVRIAEARGISPQAVLSGQERPDPGARYLDEWVVDLDEIAPMIALPGDPHYGVSLSELLAGGPIPIDVAYAGSCTGGKAADMDALAEVLRSAFAAGRRVPDGVQFYVQFASERVRRHAERRGYLELFLGVGATVLPPGCGACIRAGPGASERPDQVTISAINRNYPGRSGPGAVYLASPYVVAASALAGTISAPDPQP